MEQCGTIPAGTSMAGDDSQSRSQTNCNLAGRDNSNGSQRIRGWQSDLDSIVGWARRMAGGPSTVGQLSSLDTAARARCRAVQFCAAAAELPVACSEE